MESNRQKKVAAVLQKDIADVLQKTLKEAGISNVIISVTKVRVTVDLSDAKAYLSIFPTDQKSEILAEIQKGSSQIKHQIAQRTKHQLRKMPELTFSMDDSLEYIDKIEQAIKGDQNPISNPDLLERRKKK